MRFARLICLCALAGAMAGCTDADAPTIQTAPDTARHATPRQDECLLMDGAREFCWWSEDVGVGVCCSTPDGATTYCDAYVKIDGQGCAWEQSGQVKPATDPDTPDHLCWRSPESCGSVWLADL